MYNHILLPTDGSDLSQRAARAAIDFAKSRSAQVTILHTTPVFYPSELGGHAVFTRVMEHEEQSKKNAQQALDVIEKMARDAGVAVNAVHRVSDHPWEEIIAIATEQGCDLIFMASHGRRGINALLMGSETSKVLVHTKIPVLVWR